MRKVFNVKPQRVEVNHNDLTSVESHVHSSRVENYKNNPSHELPNVYKHNGKHVLWDGTHRIIARMDQGYKSSPVNLYDLDTVLDHNGKVKE